MHGEIIDMAIPSALYLTCIPEKQEKKKKKHSCDFHEQWSAYA